MGLKANIISEDIFDFHIKKHFEVVLSFGFIEHFENEKLQEALLIHLELLKPGGLLFLSMPNIRYINYIFTYLFRNHILPKHNIKIMNKEFFRNFSKKYDLEILYLDYFGGIHPRGLKIGTRNIFSKFFSKFLVDRIESVNFFDNLNSKYFSHHIGAIFKKNTSL